MENKVVECSICQSSTQVQPAPVQKHQEVTLLVKDHTSNFDEAIRLVATVISILPSATMMGMPSPIFAAHAKLSLNEINSLMLFYGSLQVPLGDSTNDDRVKRVSKILHELVSAIEPGKEDSAVPNIPALTFK